MGGLKPIHSRTVSRIKEYLYPLLKDAAQESMDRIADLVWKRVEETHEKVAGSLDGAWSTRGFWAACGFVPFLVLTPGALGTGTHRKIIAHFTKAKSRHMNGKCVFAGNWDKTSKVGSVLVLTPHSARWRVS
jgi:hypothetical protein